MSMPIKQTGVAAVEFAILLPLLLIIVFGITEFGRALYAYNTILKGARDAARYYSTQQPGNPPLAATAIKNLAVYGNTAGTGAPLAPALTTAMVTLCDWQSCPSTHQGQGSAPVENLVTVTVTGYPFQTFMPSIPYLLVPGFFQPCPGNANSRCIIFGALSTTMKGIL